MKVPQPDVMDKYTQNFYRSKGSLLTAGEIEIRSFFKGSIKPKPFYYFKKQINQPIRKSQSTGHS